MDFTQKKYTELCEAIAKSNYRTLTVADFINLKSRELHNYFIILRHDVDRSLKNALKIAKVENSMGLVSSYYFRIPATWNETLVKKISAMGHEVGLHYECVDKAKGDIKKAGQIIKKELSILREVVDVQTVSMHGNPLTEFDNRDIWKHYRLDQFGLIGEVYLTMDFEKVLYYSDTGRTWGEGKFNIKDIIPAEMQTVKDKPVLVTTDDLIELIKSDSRNIYLLTHPCRWPESFCECMFAYLADTIRNYGKRAYNHIFGK
ncbi:hypothetical protein HQ584_02780 [Patescibacteria group bacterium]|nr:hypothetical protein [Patescibacteria group bacterium]